jgi:hypothetical protein
MPQSELVSCYITFLAYDADGSGAIEDGELEAALAVMFGAVTTEPLVPLHLRTVEQPTSIESPTCTHAHESQGVKMRCDLHDTDVQQAMVGGRMTLDRCSHGTQHTTP